MANGFESLRKLADVLNVETARISGDPQRLQLALGETQARKLQETESALNQAIDASDIPESQKRLLKALDYQSKAKLLYEAQKPPKEKEIPADIQKLEQFGLLKSKLDENSPNYDPTYTVERLNQDASILGVNANLLDKTKTQYINEYMKEGRKEKTQFGRRVYSDEQLLKMAEDSYDLVYKTSAPIPAPSPSPQIDEEEIIDLGSL